MDVRQRDESQAAEASITERMEDFLPQQRDGKERKS